MKKPRTRPNSENAFYKVVVAPATATEPERATFFRSYKPAVAFLDHNEWEIDRLYFRDDPDDEWEHSEPYEPPRSDLHEVAITIHLSIRANSDLKAQNTAIDLIERVTYWLLEHPDVDRLAVPLSPTNPRTIARKPLLPVRKAAMDQSEVRS